MRASGSMFAEPTPCCAKLRCKSMYFRADERPGMLHHEEAMDYWCEDTNASRGPDRRDVLHPLCQPGRGCFAEGAKG